MGFATHMLERIEKVSPAWLVRGERKGREFYRYATSTWRCLPQFLVIGAMRSGTTSLFSYLVQHPQILGSFWKETHYFDGNYWRGERWYHSCFPYKNKLKEGTIVGEATPYYLFHPHGAKRIHALLPNAKLIVVLRNPTDRAISHYYFSVAAKRETLPIMDALRLEEKRIQPELEKMQQDESYFSEDTIWFSYKQRGLYNDQLEKYWEIFDRKQLLIVNNEDLLHERRSTLKAVFEFLGIDPSIEIKDLARRDVTDYPEDIPFSVYQYLNDYFAPYNQQLFENINQNYGW